MDNANSTLFYELLLSHKAILLRLDEECKTYEAYTLYTCTTMLSVQDVYRKPYILVPSYNQYHLAQVSLAGESVDGFKETLKLLGFEASHQDRYEALRQMVHQQLEVEAD